MQQNTKAEIEVTLRSAIAEYENGCNLGRAQSDDVQAALQQVKACLRKMNLEYTGDNLAKFGSVRYQVFAPTTSDSKHGEFQISDEYVFRFSLLDSGIVKNGTLREREDRQYPISNSAVSLCLAAASKGTGDTLPSDVCGADIPGIGRAMITKTEREILNLPEPMWKLNATPA